MSKVVFVDQHGDEQIVAVISVDLARRHVRLQQTTDATRGELELARRMVIDLLDDVIAKLPDQQ